MIELIENHRAELEELCRKHHVKTLELFGSAADGTWDPSRSDLDFLVDFPPGHDFGPWIGDFFDLKDDLERLFGRKVDLVMPGAIRNRFFLEAINKQRKTVYAA
jgi:predicted nucleotidyltransferase